MHPAIQARHDQDMASAREDIDLLTYQIVRIQVELTAMKALLAITFMLCLLIPCVLYFVQD